MTSLLTAWLLEMGIITYRGARRGKFSANPVAHLALPSEYVASFILYGALALVPGEGQRVAAAIGWGVVAATFLNLWDPTTIGNPAGAAVKGGPSTKTGSPPAVTPPNYTPVNPAYGA